MARKLAQASRTERSLSKSRSDRALSQRNVTENRVLTDSERLDMFRKSMFQSALPDLPKIPGYHVCWLTTTNPRDSIPSRIRLGYELITASDIPGWEHAALKSGDYIGCVGVNEMIAAKLPLSLYQSYMGEAHHEAPNSEEEKLKYQRESVQEEAAKISRRRPIVQNEGEGYEEMEQQVLQAPDFAEQAGES